MSQRDLELLAQLLQRAQEMFTQIERIWLNDLLQRERMRIAGEQVKTNEQNAADGAGER